MHGYEWANSPHANYTIEGLTAQTHGPYCRDALAALLRACPAISGVTFRIHGESGVAEGSYDFWKTVFDGVVRSGRKIEIDMHAKGIDQGMIDVALATGMPVRFRPNSGRSTWECRIIRPPSANRRCRTASAPD